MNTLSLYGDVKAITAEFDEPMAPECAKKGRGGHCQPDRLRWVAELCAGQFPGDFVEIGAKTGVTTCILAEVAQKYGRRVVVVDPWGPGSPECEGWEYDAFLENTAEYADIIDIFRTASTNKDTVAALKARPLCFAFVDGLHRYDVCYTDIMNVAHTKGVIVVDDIYWKVNLGRAFFDAAWAAWRFPVYRNMPPMREGYLLPAGPKPVYVNAVEVLDRLCDCIDSGRPLSVIRINDGGARLLAWPEFTERRTPLFRSLDYWFGPQQFSWGDLTNMANNLRQAARQADIIGVPDEEHRRRPGDWDKVELYLKAYNLVAPGGKLANGDLHIEFYQQRLFQPLLKGRESISIIGCRGIGRQLQAEYGIGSVRWYPVPVEAQTMRERRANYHWPTRYHELMDEIKVPYPGHLFLIGAGPLGKMYAARVKERGGVAFDIGSIFDVWAGVRSRSYMDEL